MKRYQIQFDIEPQREKSASPKQAEAKQAEAGQPTTSESSEDGKQSSQYSVRSHLINIFIT